jgi:hypothetical protein
MCVASLSVFFLDTIHYNFHLKFNEFSVYDDMCIFEFIGCIRNNFCQLNDSRSLCQLLDAGSTIGFFHVLAHLVLMPTARDNIPCLQFRYDLLSDDQQFCLLLETQSNCYP